MTEVVVRRIADDSRVRMEFIDLGRSDADIVWVSEFRIDGEEGWHKSRFSADPDETDIEAARAAYDEVILRHLGYEIDWEATDALRRQSARKARP